MKRPVGSIETILNLDSVRQTKLKMLADYIALLQNNIESNIDKSQAENIYDKLKSLYAVLNDWNTKNNKETSSVYFDNPFDQCIDATLSLIASKTKEEQNYNLANFLKTANNLNCNTNVQKLGVAMLALSIVMIGVILFIPLLIPEALMLSIAASTAAASTTLASKMLFNVWLLSSLSPLLLAASRSMIGDPSPTLAKPMLSLHNVFFKQAADKQSSIVADNISETNLERTYEC